MKITLFSGFAKYPTCACLAIACLLGTQARAITYSESQTVSTPVALEDDLVIEVASGKTVIYDASAVISGEHKVSKTGAGTLILSGANTFTGGVDLEAGFLAISNNAALGTGTLTILGQRDGYTGPCELWIMGAGSNDVSVLTIANPIHVTGTTAANYPAILVWGQNSVITGKVTADADFYFFDEYESTKAIYKSQYNRYDFVTSLTFGELEVAGTIGNGGWCSYVYNGKVTTTNFNMKVKRSARSWESEAIGSNSHAAHKFNVASEIGAIVNGSHPVHCNAANVLDGTLIDWENEGGEDTAGLYHLYGNAQRVGAFMSSTKQGTTSKHCWRFPNESAAVTVTIAGVPLAEGETEKELVNYRGQLWNKLSLVLDAYDGFTQAFSLTNHAMSGSITVTKGRLRVKDTAKFTAVPSISVGVDGKVLCESDANVLAFPALTTLSVDGQFAAPDVLPFDPAKLKTIRLGANALLTLPAGTEISPTAFTVDGVTREGKLTHRNCPQLAEGVTVFMPVTNPSTADWDGEGADRLIKTPENWAGDVLPDVYGGVLVPRFTTGTDECADVDGDYSFYGMVLDAPNGFTLADAGGSLDLANGGLRLARPDGAAAVYELAAKTTFRGGQNWDVPQGTALRFRNVTTPAGEIVTVGGRRGSVEFIGDENVVGGGLSTTDDYIVVSGRLKVPGAIPTAMPGANNRILIDTSHGTTASSGAEKIGLCVSNAVVEAPVYCAARIGTYPIFAPQGTTNEILAPVSFNDAWSGPFVHPDAEISFRGGIKTTISYRPCGKGTVRYRDVPVDLTGSVGLNQDDGTGVFEVSSNKFNYLCSGHSEVNGRRPNVVFAVNDVINSAVLLAGYFYSGSFKVMKSSGILCTVDFNATTQHVEYVYSSTRGRLTGLPGSLLEVTKGGVRGANVKGEDGSRTDSYISGALEGGLSVLMSGASTLAFTNVACTSTGDLIVANGEVSFAEDASWANAANVVVSGAGALKIGRSRTFGAQTVLRLADEGRLTIPDGKILRVAECWVDGAKIDDGVYTYSTAPDALKAHLAETTGTLRVGKVGLMGILR